MLLKWEVSEEAKKKKKKGQVQHFPNLLLIRSLGIQGSVGCITL